jgi:hypothetical protein
MGVQLVSFYQQAKSIGGLKAQMRLAVLTALPSSKASSVPDSPDLLKKFENAMKQIKSES